MVWFPRVCSLEQQRKDSLSVKVSGMFPHKCPYCSQESLDEAFFCPTQGARPLPPLLGGPGDGGEVWSSWGNQKPPPLSIVAQESKEVAARARALIRQTWWKGMGGGAPTKGTTHYTPSCLHTASRHPLWCPSVFVPEAKVTWPRPSGMVQAGAGWADIWYLPFGERDRAQVCWSLWCKTPGKHLGVLR